MARQLRSVFLERKSYRRRRMMDGLRLVVILGAILWVIPVFWPVEDAGGLAPVSMSRALFYVFGVWAVLIVLAAALVRGVKENPRSEAPPLDGPEA